MSNKQHVKDRLKDFSALFRDRHKECEIDRSFLTHLNKY